MGFATMPRRLGAFCGSWDGAVSVPPGALERDEEKIRIWKQKRWPELNKRPKTKAGRSSSSTKAD